MNEQQSTTNSNATTNKPDYITRLTEKAARLEKELAETRKTLKTKRQAKAALENAAKTKARTRLLILGGLALAKGIEIAATAGKDQTAYWSGIFAKAQASQTSKSDRQRAKLQEDQRLFALFIEWAKTGQF